jgi:solute carrier family 25 protein 39/40
MVFAMRYSTSGELRAYVGCGRALARLCACFYRLAMGGANADDRGADRVIGVPASTAYMLTYDYLLREGLPPHLPSPTYVPLAAGMLARAAISTIMSPLELVRTNLQSTPLSASAPHTLRSVLASVRRTVAAHGTSYLWRGLGPTLLRDVPFSGIYWTGYESLKQRLAARGHRGVDVSFACGALSGMLAATLTAPVDVIKTRRQAFVMSHPGLAPKASMDIVREIIAQEGRAGLFAGLAPRFAKIAPACGIMIACFEVRLGLLVVVSKLTNRAGHWTIIGKKKLG